MTRLRQWADREYSRRQRLVFLVVQALAAVVVVPGLLAVTGPWLDAALGLPPFDVTPASEMLAGVLMGAGLAVAIWAVQVTFEVGHGTPAPMMPPKRLVVQGPYNHCRNPMVLGTALFYLGVGIWLGSAGGLLLVVVLDVGLVAYAKAVEEKELAARFGEDYREYRQRTPFLLPRP
ncbi:methyltransferase family protein [Halobacteriaceae archaeon GCM10025711]